MSRRRRRARDRARGDIAGLGGDRCKTAHASAPSPPRFLDWTRVVARGRPLEVPPSSVLRGLRAAAGHLPVSAAAASRQVALAAAGREAMHFSLLSFVGLAGSSGGSAPLRASKYLLAPQVPPAEASRTTSWRSAWRRSTRTPRTSPTTSSASSSARWRERPHWWPTTPPRRRSTGSADLRAGVCVCDLCHL